MLRRLLNKEIPKVFYKTAFDEVVEKRVDPATFAKALAQSNGSEDGTRSFYVKLRAEELFTASQKPRPAAKPIPPEPTQDELMRRSFHGRYPDAGILGQEAVARYFKDFTQGKDIDKELTEAVNKRNRHLEREAIILTLCVIITFTVLVTLIYRQK
jgi:hypothetical protein